MCLRLYVKAMVCLLCVCLTTGWRAAEASDWLQPLRSLKKRAQSQRPPTCPDPAIEVLAREIDWLEAYLDKYGTIVAKQPDIWGEARLTKHRDEFERVMFKEINGFESRLNAVIERSDQLFFANSFALSAALGEAEGVQPLSPNQVTVKGLLPEDKTAKIEVRQFDADRYGLDNNTIGLEPTVHLDQLNRYLHHLHELRRINEGDDTSDSPGYSLNLVRIPVSVLPGKETRVGYGAEITVTATPYLSDSLLPTTFRNLVINDLVAQLRLPIMRIAENEDLWDGDDLADEVNTDLINSDLGDLAQVAFAYLGHIARDLQNDSSLQHNGSAEKVKRYLERLEPVLAALDIALQHFTSNAGNNPEVADKISKIITLAENLEEFLRAMAESASNDAITSAGIEDSRGNDKTRSQPTSEKIQNTLREIRSFNDTEIIFNITARNLEEALFNTLLKIRAYEGTAPSSPLRQALQPIPPSRIGEVFGSLELILVAREFRRRYGGRHVRWAGANDGETERRVHLLDVERFLRAEITAAYNMLASNAHYMIWHREIERRQQADPEAYLSDGLGQELRNANDTHISRQRRSVVQGISLDKRSKASLGAKINSALAWAILVEAALLNDHLNQDIAHTAASRGCHCMPQGNMKFYLPKPSIEIAQMYPDLAADFQQAAQVFNEYVRCRWPIHVFALDPVVQEQNVADVSNTRREMQLALALSFVSGQINAQNFTQLARNIATNIETIALNRTVVGFSHGSDTFGWRFQPRVQSPPNPGVLAAIAQTWSGGPNRDYVLHKSQLEAGQRECMAIIIMPSFVPYCDFDVRSNWFKLTNPRETEMTMHDTVRLSRSIKSMEHSAAACSQLAHLYRDGEVQRMLRRVHQLDRELPLQTMRAQVPYENTLGGFEMFNTGVTDLAPELIGWYGAPVVLVNHNGENKDSCFAEDLDCESCQTETTTSIKRLPPCEGKGTTLFLVGDNFSVHDTKVIAGGVCIPHVRLISRDIAQVTIPKCAGTVAIDGKDYVPVYIATPYGVTNHLHIPATGDAPTSVKEEVKKLGDTLRSELKQKLASFEFSDSPTMSLLYKFALDAQDHIERAQVVLAGGQAEGSFPLKLSNSYPKVGLMFSFPQEVRMGVAVRDDSGFLTSIHSVKFTVGSDHVDVWNLNKLKEVKVSYIDVFRSLQADLRKLLDSGKIEAEDEFDVELSFFMVTQRQEVFPIPVDNPLKLKFKKAEDEKKDSDPELLPPSMGHRPLFDRAHITPAVFRASAPRVSHLRQVLPFQRVY